MAFENLIQLTFSSEELQKTDTSLQEIEKVLQGKMLNPPRNADNMGRIAHRNKLLVDNLSVLFDD